MPKELRSESELNSPSADSLPPYSSTWNLNRSADDEKKRSNWKSWNQWKTCLLQTASIIGPLINRFWVFISLRVLRKPPKKQIIAFLLLLVFAIAPIIVLGALTPSPYFGVNGSQFYGIFNDKTISCGSSFGTPENSTVTGIEKVFVLDKTFGEFSFSQVKTIDVAWDILVGRCVQLLAWWIGYSVFCDALLRAIERHPASFEIFQRIALEGPSLVSLWTLIKEICCVKSIRTKLLFFHIWISTIHIICIPLFLSAMTGYDSTSIPWVSLEDDNNIVPVAAIPFSWAITQVQNTTLAAPFCIDSLTYLKALSASRSNVLHCNCQLKNGTIIKPYPNFKYPVYGEFPRDCDYNFPGNNQTYKEWRGPPNDYVDTNPDGIYKCTETKSIKINGRNYDAIELNGTLDYCYNSKIYQSSFLYNRTRCLPDTANPSYKWGFSILLSAVFIFINLGWSSSMYIVWQDAQLFSSLVKEGYVMTPLRAAFAMVKAAKRKTGMGEKALVRANTMEIEQELYGNRNTGGTTVEFGFFAADDAEHGDVEEVPIRKRHVRPKSSPEPLSSR